MNHADIHKLADDENTPFRDDWMSKAAAALRVLADVMEVGQAICVADLNDGYTRARLLGAMGLKLDRVEALKP